MRIKGEERVGRLLVLHRADLGSIPTSLLTGSQKSALPVLTFSTNAFQIMVTPGGHHLAQPFVPQPCLGFFSCAVWDAGSSGGWGVRGCGGGALLGQQKPGLHNAVISDAMMREVREDLLTSSDFEGEVSHLAILGVCILRNSLTVRWVHVQKEKESVSECHA